VVQELGGRGVVAQQRRGVQGSGEPRRRRLGVGEVVSGGLPDPQGVAAGVGHQELAHAVGGVLQRPDPGQPTGWEPAERGAQPGAEGVVEPVDVGGGDVAGAVGLGRVVGLGRGL
jgi:hypothetical protein